MPSQRGPTRQLGLQTEREVEQQFDPEVGQDRFTRLDRDLIMKIGEDDAVDMRPSNTKFGHGDQHYRLLKRLKKLEQLGLAWEYRTWALEPLRRHRRYP